ncbi:MAG TPA: phage major capsid protein [Spirochaetota bacterium]|nr:phage major capsid protein [Spirochaetota bacterium]
MMVDDNSRLCSNEDDVRDAILAYRRHPNKLRGDNKMSVQIVKIDASDALRQIEEARKTHSYRRWVTGFKEDPFVPLNESDFRDYGFLNLVRGLVDLNAKDCRREIEISEHYKKQHSRHILGAVVPFSMMARDLTKGTPANGGNLVGTDHKAASFIDILRNKMVVRAAGARILDNLVGDVAIPSQTGATTAEWVSEGGSPTKSQPAFGKVELKPKTVAAYVDISRKMLLQATPAVDQLVRADLMNVLAIALDKAALCGSSSSDEPTGILNADDVLDLTPADLNYGTIVDMETAVTTRNVEENLCCYVTHPRVKAKLKTMFLNDTYGSTPLWTRKDGLEILNGCQTFATSQIPYDTGNSHIIFGDFSQLIMAIWGAGIEINIDRSILATSGGIRIVAFLDCDMALRISEAFAKLDVSV